jgi:hypothetical protein
MPCRDVTRRDLGAAVLDALGLAAALMVSLPLSSKPRH